LKRVKKGSKRILVSKEKKKEPTSNGKKKNGRFGPTRKEKRGKRANLNFPRKSGEKEGRKIGKRLPTPMKEKKEKRIQ